MDPRYLFVVIYLIVDILYVYLSQPVYKRVIRSIQGSVSFGTMAGVLAYLIMALSWLFFVPAMTASLQKSYRISRTLAAGLTGMMLGIAIYGVFNFTNSAMFEKWSGPILIRDLAWGISWLTIISAAYGYFTTP